MRQPDGSDAWTIGENIVRPAAAADLYGGKGRDEYVPFGGRYEGTPGTGTPEQRIQEQNQDGIDAEVLFPSQQGGPKFWRRIEDDAAYKAVVHAYNSWLAEEYCAVDPSRLIGVGILPLTCDVADTIDRDGTTVPRSDSRPFCSRDFPAAKPTLRRKTINFGRRHWI